MKTFLNDWLGKWEDKDGYWLKIEQTEEGLNITRSGNLNSKIKLITLSDEGQKLLYEEQIESKRYKHTLTKTSQDEINDQWHDIDLGMDWLSFKLKKLDSFQYQPKVDDSEDIDEYSCKLLIREKCYDEYQHHLTGLLANCIFEQLEEAIDDKETVDDLTDKITFAICSILDSSQSMEFKTTDFKPRVTFCLDENNKQFLLFSKSSWMHEYAIGFADMFREKLTEK